MKKGTATAVIVIVALTVCAGLLFTALANSSIEDLILCSTEEETHRIPRPLCATFLRHQRGRPQDVAALETRAGIHFLLNISDKEARYEFLSFFLERGLDINKLGPNDQLRPLHVSVLNNDREMTDFLLKHGADSSLRDDRFDLTPLEFAKLLQHKNPGTDLKPIIELLSNYSTPSTSTAPRSPK